MLHLKFNLTPAIRHLLEGLSRAREELDAYLTAPSPIWPELRRHVIAASVHYSTRIEGNTLTLAQVETLLRGGQVSAPPSQAQEARNYYEAMQYAQSVATAPSPRVSEDTTRLSTTSAPSCCPATITRAATAKGATSLWTEPPGEPSFALLPPTKSKC